MKTKILSFFGLFLLIGFLACGYSSPAAASEKIPEKFMKMGTSSSGGIFNALGVLLCQMWTEKITPVNFSAKVTQGSAENALTLGKKEIEVAFVEGLTASEAFKGEGQFKGKACPTLRVMANLFPAVLHFAVLKKSNINNILDFQGKKINVGTPGSGTETVALTLFDFFGLKAADFSPRRMKHADAATAVSDEKIDGYFQMGGLGIAHQMRSLASGKVKLVPVEPKELREKFLKRYPHFYEYIIPAKAYPHQDEPVLTIASPTLLVTHEGISDELVYRMTKEVFLNVDSLAKAHATAKEFSLPSALKGVNLPLHPGAERYFKEAGILK
jgi:hypothetical protein